MAAAAPANLTFSELTVSEPLLAGGAGTLGLAVTNTGALPSGDVPVTITTPGGVTPTGITADAPISCTAPDRCTLGAIQPHATVALTFAVTIAPTTEGQPGDADVDIDPVGMKPTAIGQRSPSTPASPPSPPTPPRR